MLKAFLFAITVFLMGSCTSVGQSYGPDGRVAYTLNCPGTVPSWSMCMRAAGDQCGAAGYDVVDRIESGSHRSMVISCKD